MKINPAALGPRFALDLRNGPFSDPVDARTSTSGSWVMDAVIDRTRIRSDPPLCGVPIVRQRRINRLAKITVFFMLIPRMADQPPRVNISGGGDIVGHPRRQVETNRAVLDTLWSRLFTRFGKPGTSCAISLRVILLEKDGGKLVERRLVKKRAGAGKTRKAGETTGGVTLMRRRPIIVSF